MVRQALVLVGGNASRLRSDAIEVPLSKAFMTVASKPLLHWNLLSLHAAGIRRLVIAGNQTRFLREAEKIIRSHPCTFDHVDYFRDEGNGVHGIPYELRYLLDDTYIFECGHSFSEAEHYIRLVDAKRGHTAVFSAYKPHAANRRQPVAIRRGKVLGLKDDGEWAIAHPIVADRAYASQLLRLGFNIGAIITHYAQQGSLRGVPNSMPAEYDVSAEMTEAHDIYEHYIASIATI